MDLGRSVRLGMRTVLALMAAATLAAGSLASTPRTRAAPILGTLTLTARPLGSSFSIAAGGTYAAFPSELDVYIHQGAAACPATSRAENTRVEQQIQRTGGAVATVLLNQELGTNLRTSGDFSAQGFWGDGAPDGTYWACAYLLPPRLPGNNPADPPRATAAVRLMIRAGRAVVARPASSVRIDPFYTVAQELHLTAGGPAPARVRTYRFGVKFINIFFRFSGAASDAPHWTYTLTTPGAAGAVGNGPAITTTTAPRSGTVLDSIFTVDHRPFPRGAYRLSLVVGGDEAAATTFTIAR